MPHITHHLNPVFFVGWIGLEEFVGSRSWLSLEDLILFPILAFPI
jgi:hypothetical protein